LRELFIRVASPAHPGKESSGALVDAGRLLQTLFRTENDPMTVSLEAVPPGMTIDERIGRIQWAVPAASPGSYPVNVVVKESREGWASQAFDVALTPSSSSSFDSSFSCSFIFFHFLVSAADCLLEYVKTMECS
jgi:hypothetical protein